MAIKFNQNDVLWEEIIPGGNHWSGRIRRGTALRITDLSGGAKCSEIGRAHV